MDEKAQQRFTATRRTAARRSFAVLAVAAAGLSLAACGGGDDALTADEFRAEARKICAETREEMADSQRPTGSQREYARDLERRLEINERGRTRLARLEPPDELVAARDSFLSANGDGIELTRQIADRLRRGERRTAVFTDVGPRIRAIAKRSADAAKRFGVPECGSDL
jgi:hypothetical protein